MRAVLAYRTDPDRQGESSDVQTWPEWDDPRTPGLLYGLLAGLAAKLCHYAVPQIPGLTASIRQGVAFLRARACPTKKWLRPFALQSMRHGAPVGCMPKCLRRTVSSGVLYSVSLEEKCGGRDGATPPIEQPMTNAE